MKAGELHRLLSIEAGTDGQNSEGKPTKTWAEVEKRYGGIKPMTADERVIGDKEAAAATHKITVRYTSSLALTSRHRIVSGSRVFNILSVINVGERDRELTLLCREDVT